MTDKPNFCWHIYDDVLVEPLAESLKNRITFIKKNKPKHERKTRLRLMQPVKGKLPDAVVETGVAYVKAWEAHNKAREAYDEAWEAYVKAQEAYDEAGEAWDRAQEAWDKVWRAYDKEREAQKVYLKALSDHKDEIEALHVKECPNCPWDGQTIFPEDTP